MVDPIPPRFIGLDRAAGYDRAGATVHIDVTGLLDPMASIETAIDVLRERAQQDQRWGVCDHRDLPANVTHPSAYLGIPTADRARTMCQESFRRGLGCWGVVFAEEVCEAVEAIGNDADLRAELVQVAAVCQKWVEAIDRRTAHGVTP